MGEKTPAHLAYVETLLEWFPDARVVHCLRDPRAIHVSELRRRTEDAGQRPRTGSWSACPALLERLRAPAGRLGVGRRGAAATATLARRYPERYRVLRFEDLVRGRRRRRSPTSAPSWVSTSSRACSSRR